MRVFGLRVGRSCGFGLEILPLTLMASLNLLFRVFPQWKVVDMHLIVRFLLILIMLLPAGYGVYSLYRQREIATMEGRNEELLKINRALQKDHQRLAGSVKSKGELESWEIRLKANSLERGC